MQEIVEYWCDGSMQISSCQLLSYSLKILCEKVKVNLMQTEKAPINEILRISKVSWKFRIPTIYNFGVI